MNLIIDQGNTFCKLALFQDDDLQYYYKVENAQIETLKTSLSSFNIERAILSSVGDETALKTMLEGLNVELVCFNSASKLPVKVNYETPETLGLDRIAAAVGAWKLSPDTSNLIIDIGTAVTYDMVTPENGFIGGNIAPGLDMRLGAMHHFTQRLPLLERCDTYNHFGKSTAEAMQNGAQTGVLAEINHYINYASIEYGGVSVFLTGGDASYFEKMIKSDIFAVPNLLMIGLLEILKIN